MPKRMPESDRVRGVLRAAIIVADNGTCVYCGKQLRTGCTIDHVIPRTLNSPYDARDPRNLVVACFACNEFKGGRTPQQAWGYDKAALVYDYLFTRNAERLAHAERVGALIYRDVGRSTRKMLNALPR